jgi:hypothetical protein
MPMLPKAAGFLKLKSYWLKRMSYTAIAVMKRFPKIADRNKNGLLLKTPAYSIRNSAKNCVHRDFKNQFM